MTAATPVITSKASIGKNSVSGRVVVGLKFNKISDHNIACKFLGEFAIGESGFLVGFSF
jgi:hypothetical protein